MQKKTQANLFWKVLKKMLLCNKITQQVPCDKEKCINDLQQFDEKQLPFMKNPLKCFRLNCLAVSGYVVVYRCVQQ